ncbi:MAG: DUF1579 family protein [Candidatus Sulfotelmatobacter sp.]
MRQLNALLFLLVVCFATAMQAQTPASKPAPELTKVDVFWTGRWTYEGEYKAGPLGPGGKITGELKGETILGGFFFQFRWTEKGATGETHGLEIDKYDPLRQNYATSEYHDDGSTAAGAYTFNGNTCIYTGEFVVEGKQYRAKNTMVFAADLMSYTSRGEISADGKTWVPWWEERYTRDKPGPKR